MWLQKNAKVTIIRAMPDKTGRPKGQVSRFLFSVGWDGKCCVPPNKSYIS